MNITFRDNISEFRNIDVNRDLDILQGRKRK